MMHMNYMPEKLKTAESTLDKINDYSLRSVYLITEGNNLEAALNRQEIVNEKIKILQQKKLIRKSSGIFQLLISDSLQKERINYWNNYWTEKRKSSLFDSLLSAGRDLGFRESAFEPFNQLLNGIYQPLDSAESDILRTDLPMNTS